MAKGYIYIMTNPCLKDMVKIGFAKNVEARRRQLSTTALPYEYEIYAIYETSGNLEDKKLHKMIDQLNPELRVTKSREFFLMSPDEAYNLLEAIAVISGSQDQLKKAKTDEADDSNPKIKKPPVNFIKCGIPVGAELIYIEDPSIKVFVADERKVQYEDELTSLSAVAKKLKGYSFAPQGPKFFTYNGKIISEIAKETQWKK